jgi:hypothetical protein
MNDLESFFYANTGPLLNKWRHYFEIYDRHFSRFRGKPNKIVEFGVSQGGSLKMWQSYFGRQVQLIGVDINPLCKQFEEPGIEILIGDQENRNFLQSIAKKHPDIDILIDDGGHTMKQQIHTFEELFPCVNSNGVYLVEDLHTSYWASWGGGLKRQGTFIEYSKGFIDMLNAWHHEGIKEISHNSFARSVHSLHFYDSILVVEKRPIQPPSAESRGQRFFDDFDVHHPLL